MPTGFSTASQSNILQITLDNPPLNTLTIHMMEELAEVLKHQPEEMRAIVLSGKGDSFSFGIDPKAALAADVPGRIDIFKSLGNLVQSFLQAGVPVLTVVNGPAMAGGAVLAAIGDYCIVHQDAGKICFSEAKVGLPLPMFVQELIRLRCGPQNFFEVGVIARNFGSKQALTMGFAAASYKDDAEAKEIVENVLGKISRLPGPVLRKTLLDSRKTLHSAVGDFIADPGEFVGFLTDEFLGAGLKAL